MTTNLQKNLSSPWSLLVDGTALFFGQRAVSPEKNMNYLALRDQLQRESGVSLPPRTAFFFTAADEGNPNQVKFNEMIRNTIGWHVHQVPPHEATIANPLLNEPGSRFIRFDAMIAYVLGRLTGGRAQPPQADDDGKTAGVSHVLVVSDSWALSGPVRDCVARGTVVTVVYFGSLIDNRWHKAFRDAEKAGSKLEFFDLDTIAQRLFDRARPSRRGVDEVLPDLP